MESNKTLCLDLNNGSPECLKLKYVTSIQVNKNRAIRSCLLGIPTKITDMRRKAEVLQYKKNASNMTKNQRYAYLAKHPIGNNEVLAPLSLAQASRFNAGLYVPPVRILSCDAFLHSSKFMLHTGDNGLVKSSYSSSDVPGRNDLVQLYYDSSIPLTNWKNQTKFIEVPILDTNIIQCCGDDDQTMISLQLTTVINDVTNFSVYNDTTGKMIAPGDTIININNTSGINLTTKCGILYLSYRDIKILDFPSGITIQFSINANTFTCADNPVYTGDVTINVSKFESTIFPIFTCP